MNLKERRGSQKWAIMAVDPGSTTGISQMHIYSGHRSKKLPNHAIVRFKAFQMGVAPNVNPPKIEQRFAVERGYVPNNPYYKYTDHAFKIMEIWRRFRHHAVGQKAFGIPASQTMLVMEDWVWASNPGTTARDAHAAVFIAHRLEGILHGMAYSHQTEGFGPAHVGSFCYLQPGAKSVFSDEMLDKAGLLMRGGKTGRAVRAMEHANDATKLAMAMGRTLELPGLATPFRGERPEPFMDIWRPSDPPPPIHVPADVMDPTPRIPTRARGLRRAGQPELADARTDSNELLGASNPVILLMRENEAFLQFILANAREEITRTQLDAVLEPVDLKWFWRRYKMERSPWSKMRKGVRVPSQNLLRAAQKAATPAQLRRFRAEESAD